MKHVYLYQFDPVFGFMHTRLQTWFPFNVQVYMNEHDWLARAMDKEGLDYEQRGNCFTWVEDVAKAQAIANRFLKTRWEVVLGRFADLINPALPDVLGPFRSAYYWSLLQSEFSTDILSHRASDVAEVYRQKEAEFTQLLIGKSTTRNLPPNGIDGFAWLSVSEPSREPRPPARMRAVEITGAAPGPAAP